MRHLLLNHERLLLVASGAINNCRRIGVLAILASLLWGDVALALDKIEFRIPSQRADRALTLFAKTAEIPVLFPNRDIRSITTNPLNGWYSVEEGLETLLKDTGLTVKLDTSNQLIVKIELLSVGDNDVPKEHSSSSKKRALGGVAAFLATVFTATPGQAQIDTETEVSLLEEVVVTARRREESLMQTPVSITTFSAQDLDEKQIFRINQIEETTPNLVYRSVSANNSSNASIIFIRGIGQGDFAPSVQPGVGLYVDGAYVAGSVGSVSELYDIESVEVLRGPQGTLFGRNTIGGAILINTKKPHEEFEGKVEVQVGERDHLQLNATVNIPITENLFGKVSFLSRDSDGWIETPNIPDDSGFGSDNTNGFRGALRWMNESVTVDLVADYVNRKTDGFPAVLVEIAENQGEGASWNNTVVPAGLGYGPWTNALYTPRHGEYINYAGAFYTSEGKVRSAGLTVHWDISDTFAFKSITNYREVDDFSAQDWDLSPEPVMEHSDLIKADQFSQEFHLLGSAFDDRLNWLVGAYYFEENSKDLNGVIFSLFSLMSGSIVDNSSTALFGQATYDVTDKFSFTFGGRYTDEKLDSIVNDEHQYITELFNPSCTGACTAWPPSAVASPYPWSRRRGQPDGWLPFPIPPAAGAFPIQPHNVFESDHSAFEPYLNLTYQWTDDLMTYVSYSEGFKGGGFTQRIPPGRTVESFGPESAQVYEVGGKWTGFDGNLRLTGAIFKTDYKDLQVNVSRALGGTLENASDADINGFELETIIAVTEHFQLSGGVGYLDAKYVNVDPAVSFSPDNELPNIQEWQFNASAVYRIPITPGEFSARLDWVYSDEYYVTANNDALTPSYDFFNGSIIYRPNDGRWEVALQARNLFDDFYTYGVFSQLSSDGRLHMVPAPPRQVIAKLRIEF